MSNEIESILKYCSHIVAADKSIENASRALNNLVNVVAASPENAISNIQQYSKAVTQYPSSAAGLLDAFSQGQMDSKKWLVDNIKDLELGTVFLCGGWYATLFLDSRINFKQCISFDIDDSCRYIAEILHKKLLMDRWKFLAFTRDIKDINFDRQKLQRCRANGTTIDIEISPDTIINTSCEHIEHFDYWWYKLPKDKLIILQSNNGFEIEGHVNCHTTLESFNNATPMSKVLFSGEKSMPKFNRYMRIGYK